MIIDIVSHVPALIDAGELDEASAICKQYINKYQNNENFVKYYILFQIREHETAMGITDIFSSSVGHSSDALLLHYNYIKFCLRRFEYNMPEPELDEAFQYLIDFQVSYIALYRIGEFACVNLHDTLCLLCRRYLHAGYKDIAKGLMRMI